MPSLAHLFLVAAIPLAGCAAPTSSPTPATARPPLPVEIIPSGAPARVDFRVTENANHLQVVAVAAETIQDLHTDAHLVGISGKVLATEIATTHLVSRARQAVAQFPLTEARRAASLRIVYHADPAP